MSSSPPSPPPSPPPPEGSRIRRARAKNITRPRRIYVARHERARSKIYATAPNVSFIHGDICLSADRRRDGEVSPLSLSLSLFRRETNVSPSSSARNAVLFQIYFPPRNWLFSIVSALLTESRNGTCNLYT